MTVIKSDIARLLERRFHHSTSVKFSPFIECVPRMAACGTRNDGMTRNCSPPALLYSFCIQLRNARHCACAVSSLFVVTLWLTGFRSYVLFFVGGVALTPCSAFAIMRQSGDPAQGERQPVHEHSPAELQRHHLRLRLVSGSKVNKHTPRPS